MRPLEPISWKNAFVDVIVGPPNCRVLITPKGSRSCVCTGITDGVTCLVSSASRSCFAFWSAWMAPRIQSISLSAREGVANSTPPASSITANTDRGVYRAAADTIIVLCVTTRDCQLPIAVSRYGYGSDIRRIHEFQFVRYTNRRDGLGMGLHDAPRLRPGDHTLKRISVLWFGSQFDGISAARSGIQKARLHRHLA